MGEYTRGIAFVLEGATEKVFYRVFLKWFAEQNNCSFVKGDNLDNGDIYFEWDNGAEALFRRDSRKCLFALLWEIVTQ